MSYFILIGFSKKKNNFESDRDKQSGIKELLFVD